MQYTLALESAAGLVTQPLKLKRDVSPGFELCFAFKRVIRYGEVFNSATGIVVTAALSWWGGAS
jgi:hypothetical protein